VFASSSSKRQARRLLQFHRLTRLRWLSLPDAPPLPDPSPPCSIAGHGTVSPRQGLRSRPSRNGVAAIRARPFLQSSETKCPTPKAWRHPSRRSTFIPSGATVTGC
jgi:hypothetical protein